MTADAYDKEWMLLGYRNAKKTGIGRACFSGRILDLFAGSAKEQIANYLLGICLQGDVTAIQNSDAVCAEPSTTAIVCGNAPVRTAIRDVLEMEGFFEKVMEYEPEDGMPLASRGAYLVANIQGQELTRQV